MLVSLVVRKGGLPPLFVIELARQRAGASHPYSTSGWMNELGLNSSQSVGRTPFGFDKMWPFGKQCHP